MCKQRLLIVLALLCFFVLGTDNLARAQTFAQTPLTVTFTDLSKNSSAIPFFQGTYKQGSAYKANSAQIPLIRPLSLQESADLKQVFALYESGNYTQAQINSLLTRIPKFLEGYVLAAQYLSPRTKPSKKFLKLGFLHIVTCQKLHKLPPLYVSKIKKMLLGRIVLSLKNKLKFL